MTVYTLIRSLERVVGRGVKGGRLMLGPYKLKRELPILVAGVCLAASLALTELPIIGSILSAGPRPELMLAAVGIALLGLMALVTTFGWVAWRRGTPNWPPQHVRYRARINQWRRRPVYVSGRGKTPPPAVIAGGKVRVRP
jgi:hypothetical protein